jgi:hypothetical protein
MSTRGAATVTDRPTSTHDNLAAPRHARRGATSDRGKCQPPAADGGGAATGTSSPSRRRSPSRSPRAWATQNTRRPRKHENQQAVRAESPAPPYGAAAAPSTGRGAGILNLADRPDAVIRAGEHWLGCPRPQNLSSGRPRGLVASNCTRSRPGVETHNPAERRQSLMGRLERCESTGSIAERRDGLDLSAFNTSLAPRHHSSPALGAVATDSLRRLSKSASPESAGVPTARHVGSASYPRPADRASGRAHGRAEAARTEELGGASKVGTEAVHLQHGTWHLRRFASAATAGQRQTVIAVRDAQVGDRTNATKPSQSLLKVGAGRRENCGHPNARRQTARAIASPPRPAHMALTSGSRHPKATSSARHQLTESAAEGQTS